MYDQNATREQRGEAPAHLSAVDDAPQTDSIAGAEQGDCEKGTEGTSLRVEQEPAGGSIEVDSGIVPVDAGAGYVVRDIGGDAFAAEDAELGEPDSDDESEDGSVEDLPMREPVRPVLSLIAGFDEMFDEIEDQWQERALCAQTDPEAFFPEKGGSTREAKRICLGCEVKDECLEYALANDERFGIWGGLSERERRRLKRGIV